MSIGLAALPLLENMLFLKDIGALGSCGAVQTATFDAKFLAVDHIAVFAVGKCRRQVHLIGEIAYVDNRGTLFATIDKDHLAIVGDLQILALAGHMLAEFVDSHYLRMGEVIFTAGSEHIVTPVVAARRSGGTVEEEGSAVLTRRQEYPGCTDLVICQMS